MADIEWKTVHYVSKVVCFAFVGNVAAIITGKDGGNTWKTDIGFVRGPEIHETTFHPDLETAKAYAVSKLSVSTIGGIVMSDRLRSALRDKQISTEIIAALEVAMLNSGVDPSAKSYAHGMEPAFDQYGVEGVHMNVLYMLGNLGRWSGHEARATKKVLKRWKLPRKTQ
jgi:hypothetical protein